MPHMSADDRLKAIREAEGETVKATLAPHFKVHHGMSAAAQNRVITRSMAAEEHARAMSKDYNEMHDLRAPKHDNRTCGKMMGRALLMAGVAAWIAIGLLAALQAYFPGVFS